jgi:hypothetical protein
MGIEEIFASLTFDFRIGLTDVLFRRLEPRCWIRQPRKTIDRKSIRTELVTAQLPLRWQRLDCGELVHFQDRPLLAQRSLELDLRNFRMRQKQLAQGVSPPRLTIPSLRWSRNSRRQWSTASTFSRDLRDQMIESTFHSIYGSPLVQAACGISHNNAPPRPRPGLLPSKPADHSVCDVFWLPRPFPAIRLLAPLTQIGEKNDET